jgi:hypothetical protein
MHPGVQRGIVGTTLAVLFATASVPPQRSTFAYQPGTYRYRVVTTVDRTQDQPADRPPFTFQVVTRQQVTLVLAPLAGDTLDLTIAVDSISVSSSLAAPAPNLDRIRGAKLKGKLSPTGRVYAFQAPGDADRGWRVTRRSAVSLPGASSATRWSKPMAPVPRRDARSGSETTGRSRARTT